jgi:hypothetical protein
MKFKEFRYFCGMFIGAVSFVGWMNYTSEQRRKSLIKEAKSS